MSDVHVDLMLHVWIAVPGFVVALCAFAAAWATMRRLRVLQLEINGQMQSLLLASMRASRSEGHEAGVADEQARVIEDAARARQQEAPP